MSDYDIDDAQAIATKLLVHSSASIRIAALDLATKTFTSSSPSSTQMLDVIQQVLPYFQTETNPKLRNQYLLHINSLLGKVRRGLPALSKSNISHELFANANFIASLKRGQNFINPKVRAPFLEKQVSFLHWLDEFLVNELQATASYQRHITALKIMLSNDLALKFKNGSNKVVSLSKTDTALIVRGYFHGLRVTRLLLDLILDPFEDVRSAAALILHKILSNVESTDIFFNHDVLMTLNDSISASTFLAPVLHTFQGLFTFAIDRAKAMMSFTGRADHADGFGRICRLNFDFHDLIHTSTATGDRFSVIEDLLSSLSENIIDAQKAPSLAIENSSMHGNLLALRYFAVKIIRQCWNY